MPRAARLRGHHLGVSEDAATFEYLHLHPDREAAEQGKPVPGRPLMRAATPAQVLAKPEVRTSWPVRAADSALWPGPWARV